ncbi:MAG: leucine-rich repeat protein [Clostridia bacterium]|nr:leucine-rich repeat protein [Clostridia bacterium]
MKRSVSILLIIVTVLVQLTVFASINSIAEEIEVDWRIKDNALIITGKGEMLDYGKYANYTSVRYTDTYIRHVPWGNERENIKEIIVDKGITKIGNIAFQECVEVENVELPKGLKEIGSGAFFFCKKLASIELPVTLEVIGPSAFSKTALESIYIPRNVNSIGMRAFEECNSLERIEVDENNEHYTSVDGVLFSKDMTVLYEYPEAGLDEYTIPSGVKRIEDRAFSEALDLKVIEIPSSVTEIGKDAFYRCKSLQVINYEGSKEDWLKIGVSTVGNDALREAVRNDNCILNFKEPATKIVLTIGENTALVCGEEKISDVVPKIVNDRTMLPARFVAENLGATVIWNEYEPDKIGIVTPEVEIVLYINSATAYVNGKEVEIDCAPFVENDRTYTPIRFIVESLGATAEWDNDTKQVTIIK